MSTYVSIQTGCPPHLSKCSLKNAPPRPEFKAAELNTCMHVTDALLMNHVIDMKVSLKSYQSHNMGTRAVVPSLTRRRIFDSCLISLKAFKANNRDISCSTLNELPTVDSDFYASSRSFADLGLPPTVCDALRACGYLKPSKTQELAIEEVLKQKDVVLAAETGSGKTLAYIAPLLSTALSHPTRYPTAALILCPNMPLCEQVASVVSQLKITGPAEDRLMVAVVSNASPPPYSLPHLVVTTPGSLLSLLNNSGPVYGMNWTRAALPSWVRTVVYDEADLLLGGGYGTQMKQIRELFRIADKNCKIRKVCDDLGISEDEFDRLPRHMKFAAAKGGSKALIDNGYAVNARDESVGTEESEHWERQYIYVAATMPREGDHTVGADIAYAHPNAVWVSGAALHKGLQSIQNWAWHSTSEEQRDEMLAQIIRDNKAKCTRTLIFVKDVASAKSTADRLSRAVDVPVLEYHKGIPFMKRSQTMNAVKNEGLSTYVLVATDAAARGLDLPNVDHIVQADFAASAMDFLHRAGRTARAGKSGIVTSLYTREDEALVGAIKEAIDAGVPVEGAFSRNRSFRNKMKKYGTYVPRGQQG